MVIIHLLISYSLTKETSVAATPHDTLYLNPGKPKPQAQSHLLLLTLPSFLDLQGTKST